MRIPAALSEADAHLGLANRLALPFAKRVFLAYPLEGRGGREFRVVGRPIPAPRSRDPAGRGPRDLRAAARRPGAARRRRARRRPLAQRARRSRRSREVGPAILHISGERDYESLKSRVAARRLPADPVDRADRRRVLGRRPRPRARGQLGLGARRGRQAGDPRAVPVRDRPTTRRRTPSYFVRRAARSWCASSTSTTCPTASARCSTTRTRLARDGRGDAARRQARRGRGDRRGADRACRALDGRRLWFVGIGGAGLSAYAQLARAWGAEVGGWDRVETPYLDGARRRRGRDLARAGRAGRHGRSVVSSAYPEVRRARRAPSSSPSSSAARRSIVVAGHARQGNDGGDDRVRPARDRARPRLADRRAGPAARRERRAGRAGSSSRATSPTARCSACRPRSPSSRTSTSTTTPSSRSLAELEARVRRAGPRRRPHVGARRAAVRRRARAARRAQPPRTRARRSRRSSSPASARGEADAGARAVHRHRPPLRGRPRPAA